MTSTGSIRSRVLQALRQAFIRVGTEVAIDEHGYLQSYKDNLLPFVAPQDFEVDLRAGDVNWVYRQ